MGRQAKVKDAVSMTFVAPVAIVEAIRREARNRAVELDKNISAADILRELVIERYGDK